MSFSHIINTVTSSTTPFLMSALCSDLSQSEFEATPRDVEDEIPRRVTYSPARKKGKPNVTLRQGGTMASLFNIATSQSQDYSSFTAASFSQDVVDRLGQLSCKMSQEESNLSTTSNYAQYFHSLPSLDTNSIPPNNNGSTSYNLFNVPVSTPRARSASPTASAAPAPATISISEKKLTIAPPVVNPFTANSSTSGKKSSKRTTTIWLHPYRERPRYLIDFDQEGVLGEGSFSVVYAARKRLDGSVYAIKKLKRSIITENDGNTALREPCALSVLQGCPYIIRYYSCWIEDSHLWLQTELCLRITMEAYTIPLPSSAGHRRARQFSFDEYSDGSNPMMTPTAATASQTSMDFITTGSTPCECTERVFWKAVTAVCSALDYMHSRGMAHLDIRPANLLLSSSNCCENSSSTSSVLSQQLTQRIESGEWIIKLGDFGLCCRMDEQSTYTEGDARYCARELITGLTSSIALDFAKADIFSLGASLLEMCSGSQLAVGGEESGDWQRIRSGGITIPSHFSPEAQQLVEQMLHPDPSQRPSAAEALLVANRQPAVETAALMLQLEELKRENARLRSSLAEK